MPFRRGITQGTQSDETFVNSFRTQMTWATVITAPTAPWLRGSGPCPYPLTDTTSRLLLWCFANEIQTPICMPGWEMLTELPGEQRLSPPALGLPGY